MTRKIRREIVSNNSLSTYGSNVKIITKNGKVTLKGPVRTQLEQEQIFKIAENVAGPNNVTNEIGIVPEESK